LYVTLTAGLLFSATHFVRLPLWFCTRAAFYWFACVCRATGSCLGSRHLRFCLHAFCIILAQQTPRFTVCTFSAFHSSCLVYAHCFSFLSFLHGLLWLHAVHTACHARSALQLVLYTWFLAHCMRLDALFYLTGSSVFYAFGLSPYVVFSLVFFHFASFGSFTVLPGCFLRLPRLPAWVRLLLVVDSHLPILPRAVAFGFFLFLALRFISFVRIYRFTFFTTLRFTRLRSFGWLFPFHVYVQVHVTFTFRSIFVYARFLARSFLHSLRISRHFVRCAHTIFTFLVLFMVAFCVSFVCRGLRFAFVAVSLFKTFVAVLRSFVCVLDQTFFFTRVLVSLVHCAHVRLHRLVTAFASPFCACYITFACCALFHSFTAFHSRTRFFLARILSLRYAWFAGLRHIHLYLGYAHRGCTPTYARLRGLHAFSARSPRTVHST